MNSKPIAVIAGANSRLGRPLIETLVDRGYSVVAGSRTEFQWDQDDNVEWKAFDITNRASCHSLVQYSADKNMGIDLLVVCSGYYPKGDLFIDQSVDEIL